VDGIIRIIKSTAAWNSHEIKIKIKRNEDEISGTCNHAEQYDNYWVSEAIIKHVEQMTDGP
jgi:hypothetical protein